MEAFGVEEVPAGADLEFIRARVVKRPKDVHRVVDEVFEVNERALIYAPRFRVLYRNGRTGEEKSMEFDGVTAGRIRRGKQAGSAVPPPPPPPPTSP
jgi:hypothetical protein